MSAPVVRVESDGGIRILTIDRQEKRNALNAEVRERLAGAVREACADPEARVLVFRGAGGKAFVAGADVGEFAERTPLEQRRAMESPNVFDAVWDAPLPTIASIHGWCLGGGCELALACDIRIGADTAQLGQPEVRLGILPGGGATQRLPRLVGYGKALQLVLSGELVDGISAMRLLQSILSSDPDERDMPAPWAKRPPRSKVGRAQEAARVAQSAPMPASDVGEKA